MKTLSLVIVGVLLMIGVSYQVLTHSKRQEVSKITGTGVTDPSAENNKSGVAPTDTATVSGKTASTAASGTKIDSVSTAPSKSNELTAVKVEHNCFSFEYKHKKEALNRDIEDFLELSNAFPIVHEKWNKDTLCVKVNQKAVPFKIIKNKTAEEVLIGSIVGPESVIRVSYCTGKASCKEACASPKKRFMDDLEEDAAADDSFQDSWGNTNENNKKELKAKAKELRSVASENESLDNRSIERDWDTLKQNEWTCKEK